MQQYPKYETRANIGLNRVEFVSVGKKGNIDKIILFQETGSPIVFNLAFGDKAAQEDGDDWDLDDSVNSDNGDRDIILATVAAAVYDYTSKNPGHWIGFYGSTEARTRLYRMAITKNYQELCKDFHIFGVANLNDEFVFVPFERNGKYEGFLVKRKIY